MHELATKLTCEFQGCSRSSSETVVEGCSVGMICERSTKRNACRGYNRSSRRRYLVEGRDHSTSTRTIDTCVEFFNWMRHPCFSASDAQAHACNRKQQPNPAQTPAMVHLNNVEFGCSNVQRIDIGRQLGECLLGTIRSADTCQYVPMISTSLFHTGSAC